MLMSDSGFHDRLYDDNFGDVIDNNFIEALTLLLEAGCHTLLHHRVEGVTSLQRLVESNNKEPVVRLILTTMKYQPQHTDHQNDLDTCWS